jgi:hypothetical protein
VSSSTQEEKDAAKLALVCDQAQLMAAIGPIVGQDRSIISQPTN